MSAAHVLAVIGDPTLTDRAEWAVMIALAWLASDEGYVRASSTKIAPVGRVTATTVRRVQPELIEAGRLRVIEPGAGRRPPLLYLVERATWTANDIGAQRLARAFHAVTQEQSVLQEPVLGVTRAAVDVGGEPTRSRRPRIMRPHEAEARSVIDAVFALCVDRPKPVNYIAAVKIIEPFLAAGHSSDALTAAVYSAHVEWSISTGAVQKALNAARNGRRHSGADPISQWLAHQEDS